MVVPYQVWMLQRLLVVLEEVTASEDGRTSVGAWLEGFPGGAELFELNDRLANCRVRKKGARLFSVS